MKVIFSEPEIVVNVKNVMVFATLLKIREITKQTSSWNEITRDEIKAVYEANNIKFDFNALQGIPNLMINIYVFLFYLFFSSTHTWNDNPEKC